MHNILYRKNLCIILQVQGFWHGCVVIWQKLAKRLNSHIYIYIFFKYLFRLCIHHITWYKVGYVALPNIFSFLYLNKQILKSLQLDNYCNDEYVSVILNFLNNHFGKPFMEKVLLYFWLLLPVPHIKQNVSNLKATDGKNPSSKNWNIIQIFYQF